MNALKLLLLPFILLALTAAKSEVTIQQSGGCQSDKNERGQVPTVTITTEKPPVVFNRAIPYSVFAANSERELQKWRKDNNILSYWIPEGHLQGGHLIASGMSFEYSAKRFDRGLDQGSLVMCGYFSELELKVTLHTTVMLAKELADEECTNAIYMPHMREHRTIETAAFDEQIKKLKEKEIYDVISYAEGDNFVVNKEYALTPLQRRQQADLSKAIGAYLRFASGEIEYASSLFDLSEEYISLDQQLKACK